MNTPKLHASVYIAPGARILGDVSIEENCSVWHNAVIRGDSAPIHIGAGSNIQDGCILHEDTGFPLTIGEDVTIGHGAILHGCCIESHSLIGMGAILLNGSHVEKDCIIGAGALLTQGTHIPEGSLALGSPAKVIRSLTEAEKKTIRENGAEYIRLARLAKKETADENPAKRGPLNHEDRHF